MLHGPEWPTEKSSSQKWVANAGWKKPAGTRQSYRLLELDWLLLELLELEL
jgi:hypothetical protein